MAQEQKQEQVIECQQRRHGVSWLDTFFFHESMNETWRPYASRIGVVRHALLRREEYSLVDMESKLNFRGTCQRGKKVSA